MKSELFRQRLCLSLLFIINLGLVLYLIAHYCISRETAAPATFFMEAIRTSEVANYFLMPLMIAALSIDLISSAIALARLYMIRTYLLVKLTVSILSALTAIILSLLNYSWGETVAALSLSFVFIGLNLFLFYKIY